MKKITGIVLAAMFLTTLNAQKVAEKAPLNPDFVKYFGGERKKSDGTSKDDSPTGYIPSPVQLQFNQYAFQPLRKKDLQELPPTFDLRSQGYVTSVKDQNPLGSCWTFSSIGAIESRWLQLGGYSLYNLNLSEENMATCHGFEFGIDDGGNDLIAAAYLTRLDGPATEASDPYSKDRNAKCPETPVVIPRYVPIVLWLPKDVNIVKKAILDYGAVTSSIYVDQSFGSLLSMNPLDYTFYYGGTSPVNHGVLIVGWDDNKTVTGGTSSPGQSTGAWIVKNSWGTQWGDNGYFYVSYEDSRFLSSVAVFPERVQKSEIDTLYMYDKLGMTTSYGFREAVGYGLAKFEAPLNHFINKVGTFINTSGSVVDVEIFDDFDGDTLTNLLASSSGNFCKFPGYHTVNIPAIVNGDFYVKIRYYAPGYGYPIPAEAEISFQGEDYALPVLQDSGFFWISEDGSEWKPMGANIENYEADLSIRAYADRSTNLNAFYDSDKVLTCVGSPIEFKDISNGEIVSLEWNFGSDASPVSATTSGPHFVTYSTPGFKEVVLTITGPAGPSGTPQSTYKSTIEVVDELDIFLPYSEVKLVNGKKLPINAYGADDYVWSPSLGLDTTAGALVVASPEGTITYTVNGTLGNCTGSNSITINVVDNPDNDDVCDAFELVPGGWYGVYTNQNATVEDGEPAPPEGECDEPMHWCVEGGLQNSVWFKFIGPERGVVSFDAPGMDNQLAIWKIDVCDSLFSETGRELVAAFDDYYDESLYFAAALENVTVIPGQQYFLQVDGSAGGDEGYFSLVFWDYPLSQEEYKQDMSSFNKLQVYPNPGTGIFEIALSDNDMETVKLSVFDASGRAVFMDEYVNIPGISHILYLNTLQKGMYFLNVKTENADFNRNLIIK